MKKLITIIASALTLGAYAGQENVPVAFDTSSVPVGTKVNVEADGVVFATASTTGRSLFALLPDGSTSCGLKLAGEVNNTVIDTDFTTVSACPIGWTATHKSRADVSYNSTKGAYVTNWNKNTLYAGVKIDAEATTKIHVETYSEAANVNATFYLASDEYSVVIGNSYDGMKYIQAGHVDGSAVGKYVSFKSGDSEIAISDPIALTESTEIDITKPLTYDLTISGTTLSGTVTDGTSTKEISYTLAQATSFTTFGTCLDGQGGWVGVKSVTIKDDQVPPREPMTVYATSKAMNAFVDAEGTAVEELVKGDTIVLDSHISDSVWGGGADISGLAAYKIVVDREMDLGGGNGVPAGMKLTINYGDTDTKIKGAYLAGDIGANAKIDGTGILVLGDENRHAHAIGAGTVISCRVGAQNHNGATDTVTINGAVEVSGAILGNVSFKLADGASLKVAEELTTSTVTTDVEKKRVGYNEETKTYSLIQLCKVTLGTFEGTKIQYKVGSGEWIDVEGDSYYVDLGSTSIFRYVSADESKWTVTNGENTAFKWSNINGDKTYTPDASKAPVVTPVGPTQEDVDLMVENVSESILDLINGALSVEVDTVNGVTITITGAATLEGLAESTAKTTLVGDGTHKLVTIPEIGSKKAGFYKVEATTAK